MTGTYDVNLDGAITGVVRLVECRVRDIGDSLSEQAVWFVRFRDAEWLVRIIAEKWLGPCDVRQEFFADYRQLPRTPIHSRRLGIQGKWKIERKEKRKWRQIFILNAFKTDFKSLLDTKVHDERR